MSDQLRPGDRVRVTAKAYPSGYFRGEKGIVAFTPKDAAARGALDAVRMDKAPGRPIVFFNRDEIELDV